MGEDGGWEVDPHVKPASNRGIPPGVIKLSKRVKNLATHLPFEVVVTE
jgi:hypothetical protein